MHAKQTTGSGIKEGKLAINTHKRLQNDGKITKTKKNNNREITNSEH